jgi:hypothetical protein
MSLFLHHVSVKFSRIEKVDILSFKLLDPRSIMLKCFFAFYVLEYVGTCYKEVVLLVL